MIYVKDKQAVTGPSPEPSSRYALSNFVLGLATTVFFAVEALLKMAGFGLFRNKHSYFRDHW